MNNNALSHTTETVQLSPQNALNNLCRLSQSLLDLAEQESQALIQQDMLAFAILQDEKEALSLRYLDASQDFRSRVHAFRRVDQAMLNRLETIQSDLNSRTNDNNVLINQIKEKAEHFVSHGLMTAQEYATSARMRRAPIVKAAPAHNETQAGA